jgi:protein phosphatase
MGFLEEGEVDRHKSRNKLTQHLGIFPSEMVIEPYISEKIKLKKKDIFLLCSDGLTDMVSNNDIVDILSLEQMDTADIVRKLAATAQANGGKDNMTVIVVKVY